MVSPRKRILADRPKPIRRQGSKLGAVKLTTQAAGSQGCGSDAPFGVRKPQNAVEQPQPAAEPHDQQPMGSPLHKAQTANDDDDLDWFDSSFGFDPPARTTAAAGVPGRQQQAPKPSAKPVSPNLLGTVQRGFKALLDGEAYVAERDRAASSEPSLLNKACVRDRGLDAFNAVSRAAVGVATSLDTHIEQLMDQHGWTDRSTGRGGSPAARDSRGFTEAGAPGDSRPGGGGGGASFLDFGDAGASLFGVAAAAVVGSEPEWQASSASGTAAAARGRSLLRKPASPGVAEKAAASVAALLPVGFPPKETVTEFLAEVWSSSQLGSMLSIEPAAQRPQHARGPSSGSGSGHQGRRQQLAEWGVDSGAYSNVGSEASGPAPAPIAAPGHNQQGHWGAADDSRQLAVSPTADKENQGAAMGPALKGRKQQQQPTAVDWQDFLSGDSQVLQPSVSSRASSVHGGGSVEARTSALDVQSPQQPPTPQQQHQQNPAVAGAEQAEPQSAGEQACSSPPRPAAKRAVLPLSPGTDPISEQVRSQLEALVREKAALAQENARLQRENTGLQELLSYTRAAAVCPGSGSHLGSDDEDALSDWSTMDEGYGGGRAILLPSVDNGVSPVKMRRRLSMGELSNAGNNSNVSNSAVLSDFAAGVDGGEAEDALVSELPIVSDDTIPDISAEAAC